MPTYCSEKKQWIKIKEKATEYAKLLDKWLKKAKEKYQNILQRNIDCIFWK